MVTITGLVIRAVSFFIFWIVIVPVYVLVGPLYLYRILVKWFASLRHPEWVGMMNVRDAFISERLEREDKDLASVISLVFILKGKPCLDEIRKSFTKTVLEQQDKDGNMAYMKFKHYYEYWLGYPFWKLEDPFSLNHHIRECEETRQISATPEGVTEKKFLQIMGPLATKNFKLKTSPWEILLIDNYKPEESYITRRSRDANDNTTDTEHRFLLVLRLHHTLMDGFSIVKIVVENLSGQAKEFTPRPPRRKPSLGKTILKALELVACIGYVHLKVLCLDYDFHKWHVSSRSKLACKWWTVTTPPIPLQVAKSASEKCNVAMSAVLFSAIAGGLRRYLLKTDAEKDLPKVLGGYLALPVPSHPMDGMHNCWTFANVPLPIKERDTQERMKSLHKYFNMLKRSVMPGLIWIMSPLYVAVPKWLVNLWGANRTTTIQLSSFPGPRKEVVFFGKYPVEDTMFWLPRLRGNSSLSVAVLTYNGGIRITATLDKAIFPDRHEAQEIANSIQEEMESYSGLPVATNAGNDNV